MTSYRYALTAIALAACQMAAAQAQQVAPVAPGTNRWFAKAFRPLPGWSGGAAPLRFPRGGMAFAR